MDPNLGGFIAFLEGRGLLEFDVDGNEEKHFVNRLKLQKYAFLAKSFGMPFRYRHNMYLYGPYSSELAADYYALARGERGGAAVPDRFRKGDFLKSIRNDPEWLEIAATIIDRDRHADTLAALVKDVCRIKSGFDGKFIIGVLDDLKARGLVGARA